MAYKNLPPEPYLFVKSIAEQGYSLSTAISDLIDNSVAAEADRVELLFDLTVDPFAVFIADNGKGMSSRDLVLNMRFPSQDPENARESSDLGRFGLGLKTASFSQTRKFTVVSKSGKKSYSSCTWGLNHLKKGKWELTINPDSKTRKIVEQFKKTSQSFLEYDKHFFPATIIFWEGLYKIDRLENSLEFKRDAVANELSEETSEHLGLVFHRYIEKNRLSIRLNNELIKPFSPSPQQVSDLRYLIPKVREYQGDKIKMQGIILPARSIKESKEGLSIWTQNRKSLTDMEGIYVYRNDRLIVSGGWNRMVRKSPQFQLGRIIVEIGNRSDELFQLNVSKSSLKIPYEIRRAFLTMIAEIKVEALKEYRNRVNNELILENAKKGTAPILERVFTSSGYEYRINEQHPLRRHLFMELNTHSQRIFNDYLLKINRQINDLLGIDEKRGEASISSQQDGASEDMDFYFDHFHRKGLRPEEIRRELLLIFPDREAVEEIINKKF